MASSLDIFCLSAINSMMRAYFISRNMRVGLSIFNLFTFNKFKARINGVLSDETQLMIRFLKNEFT